jgi:hypothetical protein
MLAMAVPRARPKASVPIVPYGACRTLLMGNDRLSQRRPVRRSLWRLFELSRIEFAKSEAVTQESLGAALGTKISSVIALKAREKT